VLQPDGEKLALPGAGRFTFLSVFNENPRKDWKMLLRAFCDEFRRTEPVRLVYKLHATSTRQERKVRAVIDALSRGGGARDVLLINRAMSGRDMARLYRACDAFVLPSRGEGWGRPYTEALLCGLPVIYSDCSAMRHNLNDRIAFPIAGKMVAVADTVREEPDLRRSWIVRKYFLDGVQHWYQNSEESLRAQMREVYERQHEAKRKALLGRQWIVERYALDAVRALVAERLSRCGQGRSAD
jgi:glycosyltransferase involved in cell wall biosynthesis